MSNKRKIQIKNLTNKIIKEHLEAFLKILEEGIDDNGNIVSVRGGRGYGFGHPYPVKNSPRPTLGPVDDDENEEKMQQKKKPVKISKVFKNKPKKGKQ